MKNFAPIRHSSPYQGALILERYKQFAFGWCLELLAEKEDWAYLVFGMDIFFVQKIQNILFPERAAQTALSGVNDDA
jgi:hypothetical protein